MRASSKFDEGVLTSLLAQITDGRAIHLSRTITGWSTRTYQHGDRRLT
jgi:hypothetical protein